MDNWYLHYDFGFHHIYVKIEYEELEKIINNLSTEFEIHKEFVDCGSFMEIWIEDYYGDKYTIAYNK